MEVAIKKLDERQKYTIIANMNMLLIKYSQSPYEDEEYFPSYEKFYEKYGKENPSKTIGSFSFIDSDGTERALSKDDMITLGWLEKQNHSEDFLDHYADLKLKEQNPPMLFEFGIHQMNINGRNITVTGSRPTRPLTKEEIIVDYKKQHEYVWLKPKE